MAKKCQKCEFGEHCQNCGCTSRLICKSCREKLCSPTESGACSIHGHFEFNGEIFCSDCGKEAINVDRRSMR